MLRVEFHCHTIYSKDSLTRPEILIDACQKKGIDRVVITDHNTIRGAQKAQEMDPDRVIIGEEIMTTQGEILAAFVQEGIPGGQEPRKVIDELRRQEAFISVSHPFDNLRKGHWQTEQLLEILPLVDAIEVFNARNMQKETNRLAREFAEQYNIAGTVGSDAHTAFELGTALLLLTEFSNSDNLRGVIRNAQPLAKASPAWVHLASRYAVFRKQLAGVNI